MELQEWRCSACGNPAASVSKELPEGWIEVNRWSDGHQWHSAGPPEAIHYELRLKCEEGHITIWPSCESDPKRPVLDPAVNQGMEEPAGYCECGRPIPWTGLPR